MSYSHVKTVDPRVVEFDSVTYQGQTMDMHGPSMDL